MSRGINKVILVGNLGKDPETRYTQSNTAVTTLTLATSEAWRDKATGENQEKTEWHRVVLWGRLGEIAGEYLQKGRQVYIEGKLQTRKWQDQSGQDRYTTEIVGSEMQMLGGRQGGSAPLDDGGQGGRQSGGSGGGSSSGSGADSGGGNRNQSQPSAPPDNGDDFVDDDIPF